MHLMSEKGNAKTALNVGYISGELSLAPAKTSGYNTCGGSSPGCAAACIGWSSGRNVMSTARDAKIRKTRLFFEDRDTFMTQLIADLAFLQRKGKRNNLPVCVRLNCYSDIPWERVLIDGRNVFEMFPDIQFYDYTALESRFKRPLPNNLHLTFSRKEDNEEATRKVCDAWQNVSVVFKNKLPATWYGKKVINGDVSDLRFNDERNVIVGLLAKGSGKKDTSGFVQEVM